MGRLRFPDGSLVYLDSAPIIYSVEKNPDYQALMEDLWRQVGEGSVSVVTSELTLLETLVHPVRNNDTDLVEAYESVLEADQMQVIPITTEILRASVEYRAHQNLKTPDAIHAATALLSGSTHFVTNDPTFRRLDALEVIVLSDHE